MWLLGFVRQYMPKSWFISSHTECLNLKDEEDDDDYVDEGEEEEEEGKLHQS